MHVLSSRRRWCPADAVFGALFRSADSVVLSWALHQERTATTCVRDMCCRMPAATAASERAPLAGHILSCASPTQAPSPEVTRLAPCSHTRRHALVSFEQRSCVWRLRVPAASRLWRGCGRTSPMSAVRKLRARTRLCSAVARLRIRRARRQSHSDPSWSKQGVLHRRQHTKLDVSLDGRFQHEQ